MREPQSGQVANLSSHSWEVMDKTQIQKVVAEVTTLPCVEKAMVIFFLNLHLSYSLHLIIIFLLGNDGEKIYMVFCGGRLCL